MDYTTTLYRNEDADAYEVTIKVSFCPEEVWFNRFSGQEVLVPELISSVIIKLDANGKPTNDRVNDDLVEGLESEAFESFRATDEGKDKNGRKLHDSP